MMKNTLCFKILAFLVFFGNNACDAPPETTQETENAVTNTSIRFGTNGAILPELSENVKSLITQWPVLEDFKDETATMGGKNLEQLRAKTERLRTQTDSLGKKIPDTLNTKLVTARLLVVKTRTELLYQQVHRDRIDSAAVTNNIEELNIAVSNFINQLNEKLQKDDIDFQRKDDEKKEIEKQKRFLDSVFRAELQDKTQK